MPSPGTNSERGYGPEHQAKRAEWSPVVAQGGVQCHAVICLKKSRLIQPGEPWDLGHTTDRSAWTGPEHRTCNRTEGAIRGNRLRANRSRRSWGL